VVSVHLLRDLSAQPKARWPITWRVVPEATQKEVDESLVMQRVSLTAQLGRHSTDVVHASPYETSKRFTVSERQILYNKR
jgi:peptide methionine sulfoxide reductase MsrB